MSGKHFIYGLLIVLAYEIVKDDLANAISEKLKKKIIGEPIKTRPLKIKPPVFNNVIFSNKEKAEKVIEEMKEIMERYGCVSISDFYDMVDVVPNYQDHEWGWKDEWAPHLSIAEAIGEGFFILLPRPIFLGSEKEY